MPTRPGLWFMRATAAWPRFAALLWGASLTKCATRLDFLKDRAKKALVAFSFPAVWLAPKWFCRRSATPLGCPAKFETRSRRAKSRFQSENVRPCPVNLFRSMSLVGRHSNISEHEQHLVLQHNPLRHA